MELSKLHSVMIGVRFWRNRYFVVAIWVLYVIYFFLLDICFEEMGSILYTFYLIRVWLVLYLFMNIYFIYLWLILLRGDCFYFYALIFFGCIYALCWRLWVLGVCCRTISLKIESINPSIYFAWFLKWRCVAGLAFPSLYFYNGGVKEFLATIKQHVFIARLVIDLPFILRLSMHSKGAYLDIIRASLIY
jgi:hypothetical protein